MLLSAALGGGSSGPFTELAGLQPQGVAMASGSASNPPLVLTGLPLSTSLAEVMSLSPTNGKYVIHYISASNIADTSGNFSFQIEIDGEVKLAQAPTALASSGGMLCGGNDLPSSYSNLLVKSNIKVRAAKSVAGSMTLNIKYSRVK